MAIETILLALGAGDDDRAEALAAAVSEVAKPTGADVIIAHVFDPDGFDDVEERLSEGGEQLTPDEVAERHRTVRDIERILLDGGIQP
ncbi:MAG: universal stress protein, partial [Halobacteriales archaeon]|nr:universal stress protein [Halobacteriales archaeon]